MLIRPFSGTPILSHSLLVVLSHTATFPCSTPSSISKEASKEGREPTPDGYGEEEPEDEADRLSYASNWLLQRLAVLSDELVRIEPSWSLAIDHTLSV